MNPTTLNVILLMSVLTLCLPIVSAAGYTAGSSDAFTSQDVPDFSLCGITNGSTLDPYCPVWDGEHVNPDPFLLYDIRKKSEETQYGISSLQPPAGWRGLPTKGTVKIPVFLVDFSDAPHDPNQTVADVQVKMFGNGDISYYPYESLKNYYQRSSYNQLTITGDVYGWYRASHNRSYYESMPSKSEGRDALINEILSAYDNQINYADYDTDHNGKIDSLFIKWAGPDTGWGNFWWASMSSTGSSLTVDGMRPYKYVWSWYSRPNGSTYKPQVDMHETGHLLGLPDYYDYDPGIGPKGGVGGWDMMDANWGDHNAFSKYLLGWIDPVVISSETHQIILPPSGTTSSENAVVIMPGAVPDSFGEFFMVQYREPGDGNDPVSGGPPKAVWIWHVDSTLNGGGFLYDNSYTTHKLLRLMEADGQEHIETGSGNWDKNDFYLPTTSLGPATLPDTRTYSGSITRVAVDSLLQRTSSMQMNCSIPGEVPVANFTANITAGNSPLAVQFTDTSTGTGISAWKWDFDNDTIIDSTLKNPTYTYTSPGTYSVNLTITGNEGSDSKVKTRSINVITRVSSRIGSYQNGTWYLDGNGNGAWDNGTDRAYSFGAPGWTQIVGDWNATGSTSIGVTNGQQWYLDWNGNGAWDGADKAYSFGAPGWINVTGDWNHDGKTEIGVTNGQQWYLDTNGNGAWDAGTDKAYSFGAPGWTPVIGDWNATGSPYIGVTNGQQWYLDWNGNGAWDGADKAYSFGAPGWTPIVGDWNVTGKSCIGVTNGQQWYLDANGNGAWDGADKAYSFGAPGWTPVIGDWNATSSPYIGVTNGQQWYLDWNGNGAWDGADKTYSFGAPGWMPVVGKWS